MWKFKAILIGFLGVLLLGEMAQVYAAKVDSNTKIRRVSGNIAWIDVKLGRLELNSDAGQDTRGITTYRINLQETLVHDPTDTKFLVIKDLRAGQHVILELIDSPSGSAEETMVRTIIAYPIPEPVLQEATGELEAIDLQVGTIIISQKSLSGEEGKRNFIYFVFEPKNIVVMKAPSMDPVQLNLNPGDIVKIEFVVSEGQRHARSITLLQAAPETTSTTTTTTTTTSTRKIIVEPTPAPAMQEATGELEAIDIQAGTLMIEQKTALFFDAFAQTYLNPIRILLLLFNRICYLKPYLR